MSSTTVVSLSNVSKHYGSVNALTTVNMTLKSSEVLGLFGHNGAGKTTMMKLILGVIEPTKGDINVLGMSPNAIDAWHMRTQIGYLPENVSFYEQLTGLEVLTYFAKLKGFTKKHAVDLLEQVGITHAMKRQVKTYSKGMRQRLGLAQAFIGEPKLLLLDEPTVGLDPIATAEFYQTVDQLKNQGTSVILCSHVLSGVEQHIDRAMIMSQGEVLAMGSLSELRKSANLPVTIKPHGLNGSLRENSNTLQYLHSNKFGDVLKVPDADKLSVLTHLLSLEGITDIDIEPANLDKVYQYYLAKKKTNQSLSERVNERGNN